VSTLVVFEDAGHTAFEIVAALRGIFDLRCGGRTLLERLRAASDARQVVLLGRQHLAGLWREAHPDTHVGLPLPAGRASEPVLFANARWLALGCDFPRTLDAPPQGAVLFAGATLVAARCDADTAVRLATLLQADCDGAAEPLRERIRRELPGCLALELEAEPERQRDGSCLLEHAWDLVHRNGPAIVDDFRCGGGAGIDSGALLYPGVHLVQDAAIRIAAGCRLKPGVVLDAEDGPITLEAGVDVQPNVVIRGPAHLGAGCVVKAGAKIHEGTSLGPVCKIGGELEECVVQGYSNKQHEGFLGHAYLGEWVNLGADTNNSDLKNNYSTVRVWEHGRSVDTGLRFVGLLAGDHVKSAINTQFNTGTVVGLASQIFGSGFPPKFVAPFSWGGGEGLEIYDFDKALSTARTVMQRRKITLTAAYEAAFAAAFEAWKTAPRHAAAV
jgi:UDP-N-acetylglucosamine diphosphorylase/glucosamine-1-phosphate N-acetyltransferase